jgi:uncharacterized protein YjbI with pentapeptide repeats
MAMALSSWYDGSTRIGTVELVERLLADWDDEILVSFKRATGQERPAVAAALAFYMRPGERPNSFEFLHKTFAEYLVSWRLVTWLEATSEIYVQLGARRSLGRGSFDVKGCLRDWLRLTGPRAVDSDLLPFIRTEVMRAAGRRTEVAGWYREFLLICMRGASRMGLPAHELFQLGDDEIVRRPQSFRDAVDQARNAEEALLAMLNATILVEMKSDSFVPVRIASEDDDQFVTRAMIRRLHGTSSVYTQKFLSVLDGIDFDGQYLSLQELFALQATKAAFRYCDFFMANLSLSDCSYSDFSSTNLKSSVINLENMSGCKFIDSNLSRSDLRDTSFRDTFMMGANLRESNLTEADLSGAQLRGANLSWANLRQAKLVGADLTDCDLSGADLTGADLTGATLAGTKLEDAKLPAALEPD